MTPRSSCGMTNGIFNYVLSMYLEIPGFDQRTLKRNYSITVKEKIRKVYQPKYDKCFELAVFGFLNCI